MAINCETNAGGIVWNYYRLLQKNRKIIEMEGKRVTL